MFIVGNIFKGSQVGKYKRGIKKILLWNMGRLRMTTTLRKVGVIVPQGKMKVFAPIDHYSRKPKYKSRSKVISTS